MKKVAKKLLQRAVRQYRHNTEDGLVFGYDEKETEKLVASLITDKMTLEQYQEKVEETWIRGERLGIYAEGNEEEIRITLGIAGEAGEVAELYKKFLRGDYKENWKEEFDTKVKKELGDLSYYIAKLCNELEVSWSKVLEMNVRKLQDRKKRGKIKGSGDNR